MEFATLIDQDLLPGDYDIIWKADQPGLYILTTTVGQAEERSKVIIK
jgi:hypothetical protein